MHAPRDSYDATPHTLRDQRGEWGVALVAVGGCLLLGVVVGLVWLLVAPTAAISVTGDGAFFRDGAAGRIIADDGSLALLGAGAGILTGVLGWLFGRQRVVGLAAGLVVGGLLAGVVAWWVGAWFGPASLHEQALGAHTGSVLHTPLGVRAPAVLFVWPIAAVVVLFGLVAGADQERRPAPRPASGGDES